MHHKTDRLVRSILTVLGAVLLGAAPAHASDFSEPWKRADRALVIDAYEYNPIDWQKLVSDKRIVGFINKGSDGVSPPYACSGNDTEERLCKALWKRHAVARELFHTRRTVAKALGLEWGAYHLGRPGNPIDQANNFIDFAEPAPDDLIALDIEENDSEKWMSLEDAETFARHIHARLGRWPVLYTNGSTALHIAENRGRYKVLSRLPLWYARYKPVIGLHFPKGHWDSYALWQFSAGVNCDARSCPYRVPGTPLDIDVNVASMGAKELRAAWPFGKLIDPTAATAVESAAATVPLPVARRTALNGGDVTLQYAEVEVGERVPAAAVVAAAKAAETALETGYAAAEPAVAETKAFQAFDELAKAEKVPLPIWRRTALKGGDVTLQFVPVEDAAEVNTPATAPMPATRAAVAQSSEAPVVQLANYVTVVEKAKEIDLWNAAGEPGISTAAMDNPGPDLSASQFSRADMPIFLLKKPDGTDETLP